MSNHTAECAPYKKMELVSHGTYLDSHVFYHLKNLVYWSFLSVYIGLDCLFVC